MTDPYVRVLSLNLWHDPIEREQRTDAVARLIRDEQIDIALVQEAAQLDDGTNVAERLADKSGLTLASPVAARPISPHGDVSGTAVLSRLPVVSAGLICLPGTGWTGAPLPGAATATVRTPGGSLLSVTSAHLAHGGHCEAQRLAQGLLLDEALQPQGDNPITVLGGDFNTGPDGDLLRFLRGEAVAEGRSTLWIDAWKAAGGDAPGETSTPGNSWAHRTAARVGIARPDLLPSRRIDFIMTRGWVYGRPGMPLSARVVGDRPELLGALTPPSDHFGVVADLWDPTV